MVTRSSLMIVFVSVLKHFVGKPSVFQKSYRIEKLRGKQGRGCQSRFSVEIAVSHCTETIRRRTIPYFRKFPIPEKFMDKRGGLLDFLSMNFFSQDRNYLLGNPSLFRKESDIEKNYVREGRRRLSQLSF